MKSAYGRQTPAPDRELTCVEPGNPMGELMRRYWQPVCTSDELRDLPRKEKLLCEEIVVFRDKKGRVGALDPHCAHRGTSLEWGRVEEEGLRCCYHGRPEFRDRHYASFRTGPSATADIEGVLIHGAQGVRSLSVLPLARSAGSPTQ